MSDVYIQCEGCKRVIQAVSKVVNGGEVTAVTIGNHTFFLKVPRAPAELAALKRHEAMHKIQAARYAPKWAKWLPFGWRANLGTPSFLKVYVRNHLAYGYVNNPLEVEARGAE